MDSLLNAPEPPKALGTPTEADRLLVKLQEFFPTRERLDGWLSKPNSAFSELKPAELIERGELDYLWRMIYFLESGEPG